MWVEKRDIVNLVARPEVIAKLPAPRLMFASASGHFIPLRGHGIILHCAGFVCSYILGAIAKKFIPQETVENWM